MLERLRMIYSIIPTQYLITLEYCYVLIINCKLLLDKIRNDLVEAIDNAKTDKFALNCAKIINNITRCFRNIDILIEIMFDYMRPDLVNILMQKLVWKDTIWYKNVHKTDNGIKIYHICLDYIDILKLQACDILNKDFDLGLELQEGTLDGTLNDDCLDN